MNKFSYSKINRYLKCPRNYKYHKEKGGVQKQTEDYTSFGKCVHSIIACHYNDYEPPIEVCAEFNQANAMAQQTIIKLEERYPTMKVVGVEVKKTFKIADDIELVGIIDLIIEVDGKFIEIDWKTGNWLPEYEDLKKDLQMDIYNLIIPSDAQEIWYLRHDVIYEFKKQTFDATKKKILKVIDTILKDEVYEKKVSALCSTCENNLKCFGNVIELTIPVLNEDTEASWANYFTSLKVNIKKLEKQLKQSKKVLKEYIKDKNSKHFVIKSFKQKSFKPIEVYESEDMTPDKFEKVISIKPLVLKKHISQKEYDRLQHVFEIKYPDTR